MAVTFNRQEWRKVNGKLKFYGVGQCMSTDVKPVEGLINGSSLTEMDTGKWFLFDADGSTWYEQPAGSGGGGGTRYLFSDVGNGHIVISEEGGDGNG